MFRDEELFITMRGGSVCEKQPAGFAAAGVKRSQGLNRSTKNVGVYSDTTFLHVRAASVGL